MIPYVVWSYDYSHATGGVKVLHRLAHELNEAGQEAYVSGTPNPDWNTPVSGPRVGDWIAIYPEVVSGNPWSAPRVVRYVLNVPGKLGGDPTFDPSEIVYVYDARFSDGPVLTLPAIELDIYQDRHLPRQGAVYYVGKGRKTLDLPNAAEITLDMRLDRHWLADVLNRASVMYSFDDCTAMVAIAHLCGCPVAVVPSGMAVAEDGARERARQLALRADFDRRLPAFIRTTQEPSISREIGSRQEEIEAYHD